MSVPSEVVYSPDRTLVIDRCGACPFATYDAIGFAICTADLYLAGQVRCRTFEGNRLPTPPPEWCPLRSAGLTIRVRDGGTP